MFTEIKAERHHNSINAYMEIDGKMQKTAGELFLNEEEKENALKWMRTFGYALRHQHKGGKHEHDHDVKGGHQAHYFPGTGGYHKHHFEYED